MQHRRTAHASKSRNRQPVKLNLYDAKRRGTLAFMLTALAVVVGFLLFSNTLVDDLAEQEHARMQIWADATREIAGAGINDDGQAVDFDFLLSIIEENRNIPVLLTDDTGKIITHRNFNLPEPIDSGNPLYISPANRTFLQKKLEGMRNTPNVIHIHIMQGVEQHLYYEDSRLLRSLSYYPYVQIAVMAAFIAVLYFAMTSTKKAEQNKVWVGLSKETAHQLGTPISSLMAWTELLPGMGVDKDVVDEMEKDVKRLATVASRFGKIGSIPTLEPADVGDVIMQSASYMATRISKRIKLTVKPINEPLPAMLCEPLFQWVMENLIKNAVDAMDGSGSITISAHSESKGKNRKIVIDVADSGKGIPRKNFQTVFHPGYTTKKRGWGLGLALAKRIVEQYHNGQIFVAASTPGHGTTFRLILPGQE